MAGCRTSRDDRPSTLAVAVPELHNSVGNEFSNRARLLNSALDLHEGPHDAMGERATRELVRILGRGEARLDTNVSVQRGPNYPRPTDLTQVYRNEVRGTRQAPIAAARANGSRSIVSAVERPTGTPGAAARIAATAASHAAASRVSTPLESRGCTCTANAPARHEATASSASSSAVRGTAWCSSRVRRPLRHAWTGTSVAPARRGTRSAAGRWWAAPKSSKRTAGQVTRRRWRFWAPHA